MTRHLLSIITLCIIIGTINCYYRHHRRYDPYDYDDQYGYGGGYGRRPVQSFAGVRGGLSDTKLNYKEHGKEFDYAHHHDNRQDGSGSLATSGPSDAPGGVPHDSAYTAGTSAAAELADEVIRGQPKRKVTSYSRFFDRDRFSFWGYEPYDWDRRVDMRTL